MRFAYEKPMMTVIFITLLSSRCLRTTWLDVPAVSWDSSQLSGLPQFVPYADRQNMFWRDSRNFCTVQLLSKMGLPTWPIELREAICNCIAEEVWTDPGCRWALRIFFWWFPGWSSRTEEVGETQMKGTWLHLKALCSSVWVGVAVPQARVMLNHQHPGLCLSLNYSLSEIRDLPEQWEPAEQTTDIKAPLVLIKEFSLGAVTFKTSQTKKQQVLPILHRTVFLLILTKQV